MKTRSFKIFSIIAFLFFNHPVFSQWTIVNPKPLVDNSIVIYADSENCNILTQKANLVSSTNGGTSWQYTYSNLITDIGQVFFIDKLNGWVIGYSLLKTTDGGYHWEDLGQVLGYAKSDIYFSDLQHGWAVGAQYITSTSDAGKTWNTDTIFSDLSLNFISQYNDSIFFTGGYDDLLKSTDKGMDWDFISGPSGAFLFANFLTVHPDSLTFGFLLDGQGRIYRTPDAGNTWDPVFTDSSHYGIYNLKSNDKILLTCGRDKVFRSADFGESWDTIAVPYADYRTIYFATDNTIYISGKYGSLIKSTDGGLSFNEISRSLFDAGINSISMFDSTTGFAAAYSPAKIYKTNNAFESYSDISPQNFTQEATKIFAISKNMAAAISGISILTTKNSGLTWHISNYGPPNTYVPNDIYFKDTLKGMAGCGWNLMRETTNGGDTWANRFFSTDTTQEHIMSLSFPDTSHGFYSTGDKLYKTTDGGLNWHFAHNLFPSVYNIKFIDELHGVMSNYYHLFYTTDGGNNLIEYDSLVNYYDFDIKKNGDGSELMVLTKDYLFSSSDLGVNWKKEKIPFDGLGRINMINPGYAQLYGGGGTIITYFDPSIVSNVQTNNGNRIINFKLSQNYPNPFNPVTVIGYQLPVGAQVTLKVYDALGRIVAALVNEYKPAGKYEVKLDGKNLASGIYFYQLKVGSFTKTKKMILLK